MGASGLISSFAKGSLSETPISSPAQHWKLAFMGSFFLTAQFLLYYKDYSRAWSGDSDSRYAYDPNLPLVSTFGHIISGFLVGFGTKLGNGCTTGHGICGLARFSKRSFVAVLSFMTTGILSATVCGPKCIFFDLLRTTSTEGVSPTSLTQKLGGVISLFSIAAGIAAFIRRRSRQYSAPADEGNKEEVLENYNNFRKMIPATISGSLFAAGLEISTMVKSTKIYGFLDLTGFSRGTYDPTLIVVMGGGMIWSMLSYQFIKGYQKKPFSKCIEAQSCPLVLKSDPSCPSTGKFCVPTNTQIDGQLVVGSMLFGLGWGIGGLCPGPAMFLGLAGGFPKVLFYWWPSFIGGSFIASVAKERLSCLQPKKK